MKTPYTAILQSFKVAAVTARQKSEYKWLFRYWLDGRDVREPITAMDYNDALHQAMKLNVQLAEGTGKRWVRRSLDGYTITDAIKYWLSTQTEQKQKTVGDYRSSLNSFGAFMADKFPGISHWESLQPRHAIEFMKSTEGSWHLKRRRLVILRKMCSDLHHHDRERYTQFVQNARIKLKRPAQQEKETPSNRQLFHLFAWFRREYPTLWAQLVLEAFAGLRGYEAAFLRNCDIDLDTATIAVVPNEHYDLKNSGSRRILPVVSVVVNALSEYQANAPIKSATAQGAFFLNYYGKPWSESGICTSRTKAMKRYKAYLAEKKLRALPEGFMLRELRSSFVSAAVRADVNEVMLQRYIGHVGQTVMQRHYVKLNIEDLRRGVVEKLEPPLSPSIVQVGLASRA